MMSLPHPLCLPRQHMQTYTVFLSLCLVSVWYAASCRMAVAEQLLDGIAAIVNGEIITISEVYEASASDFRELRQHYEGEPLHTKEQALFKQTLQPLIDEHLQLARAQELNLRVSEDDITYHINKLREQNQITDEQLRQMLESRGLTMETYREQIRHGLLVSKVINAEVHSRIILMESELQKTYEENKERYRVAGEVTVSHILFLVPSHATSDDEMRAKQKATVVQQKLAQGEDFVALAKQYSEGPSADRGGFLGTFRTGELLPGFEEAIAKLQPGEISDVVRTRVGWHIIRVEKRTAGTYRPFSEVKDALKAELSRTKLDKKYAEWLEALRQQAYITIMYEG